MQTLTSRLWSGLSAARESSSSSSGCFILAILVVETFSGVDFRFVSFTFRFSSEAGFSLLALDDCSPVEVDWLSVVVAPCEAEFGTRLVDARVRFLWQLRLNESISLGSRMFSSGSQVLYFGAQPFHLTKYSTFCRRIRFFIIHSAAKTRSPTADSSISASISAI